MKKLMYFVACFFIAFMFEVSKPVAAYSPGRGAKWKKMEVLATAYCPCRKCCGKFADGKTAIGYDANTKGVAVDRRLIPLRSKVSIPGYGLVVADDVGGAIKNNRIDVRFPSHQTALEWGRKNLTIYYSTP